MTIADQREQSARKLIQATKSILGEAEPDRDRLAAISAELTTLAGQAELWNETDFPEPNETEKQNRFQIAQDPETGITLYLNVMRPGKKIPPHNHTTWACVSAVEGVEINTLYNRLDDGSIPGKASLETAEVIDLKPGTGVALMPDDIHSVEIPSGAIIRHLHFYGRPLETLSGRLSYDLEAGTCSVMDIGVKTKS